MAIKTRQRWIGWTAVGAVCLLGAAFLIMGPREADFWSGPATPARADESSQDSVTARTGPSMPAAVKTIQPTRQDLKRTTNQPAHVEGYETTDVFAKATGYLGRFGRVEREGGDESDLDIGDAVVKDQVLAELWIPEMEQERAQREALLEQAESELAQAEAALNAAESMAEAAQARIAEAQTEVIRAQAEVRWRESESRRYEQLSRQRAAPEAQADEKLSALRAAEATVSAAEQAVLSARASLKVQQANVVKARADRKAALSRIKVARANLDQTQILLDYAKVRAPFDGLVTRRWVDSGAFVQSAATGKGDPLFTIVRADRLRVIADIPESDAAWVGPGQAAVLTVDAARGRQYSGRVARLAGVLDPSTRTMRVEVELERASTDLRPGMFGSVSITLADTPGALMIPASSLVTSRGRTSVMTVEDGRARLCDVTLGFNDGINVQVTQGLEGNEQIIREGKDLVRDGQAVRVVK